MLPDRSKQIEELYQSARGRRGEARAAFLAEACRQDPELRHEVQLLLDASELGPTETLFRQEQIGPYQILGPLGAGGMGQVWKARDPRLHRTVAIKKLMGQHSSRFQTEARAVAALNHPNICQIYDIGPDYLVLEYIDGKPLHGPLTSHQATKLGIQIAAALEAAHAKGILHRDLKPGNILVTAAGSAKLLDFGLAKFGGANPDSPRETLDGFSKLPQTETGAVAGTWAYMSPEQAQGRELDVRSDIFSFGVVLYELLSGQRPFRGETPFAVMNAIVNQNPPQLDAPAGLRNIVMRCLAKSPEDRFQRIGEVAAALLDGAVQLRPEQISVAVLPFANLSADKENEYFGDGLAEEIINALANISSIKVAARTSSFFFRGNGVASGEIGRRLNVEHVLEGSIRRAGNRLRVTAQLVKVADGFHMWSERYDRELTDIFAIQDEITQAIASALRLKLSPETQTRHHLPNLRAYEAYLKARDLWFKGARPELLAQFREMLERAIALDPDFALAHSFLGLYYTMQANLSLRPAHEVIPLAMAAVEAALRIDPNLPEAHALLACCIGPFNLDWAAAESHWRLAMAHQPVSRDVLFWYGNHHLLLIGRTAEAVDAMTLGLEGDPLNLTYRHLLARGFRFTGQHAEAEAELLSILEVDPQYAHALGTLGSLCAQQGRFEEALSYTEKAHALNPWASVLSGQLAALLVQAGAGDRAEAVLEKYKSGEEFGAPTALTAFHIICGNSDQAAEWAEKAVEQRDMSFAHNLGPFLRQTPQWPRLAKLMNLPG